MAGGLGWADSLAWSSRTLLGMVGLLPLPAGQPSRSGERRRGAASWKTRKQTPCFDQGLGTAGHRRAQRAQQPPPPLAISSDSSLSLNALIQATIAFNTRVVSMEPASRQRAAVEPQQQCGNAACSPSHPQWVMP